MNKSTNIETSPGASSKSSQGLMLKIVVLKVQYPLVRPWGWRCSGAAICGFCELRH